MSKSVKASDTPFSVVVEQGEKYFWCACGRSKTQPLCDGSHKGTDWGPVMYDAPESTTVFFCGCKRTRNAPLCDGSHNL